MNFQTSGIVELASPLVGIGLISLFPFVGIEQHAQLGAQNGARWLSNGPKWALNDARDNEIGYSPCRNRANWVISLVEIEQHGEAKPLDTKY